MTDISSYMTTKTPSILLPVFAISLLSPTLRASTPPTLDVTVSSSKVAGNAVDGNPN